MNRNTTALILIILAVGIYFTFTSPKIDEITEIRHINEEYQTAINNATRLITERDRVLKAFNNISENDRERLNKIVPDTVDNVRLIIDVKDDIAARHGLALKNIKTTSPDSPQPASGALTGAKLTAQNVQAAAISAAGGNNKYGTVTLSFDVTTNYQTFIDFLKDLESSLRIMDISKLTIRVGESGSYDFSVEVKTYWLKQQS